MKLQLALDMHNMGEALDVLEKTAEQVDIVEIGTPFILSEGIRPLREVKRRFPEIEILFDAKIMDAGKYESDLAYENGADIVTVLAASADATIQAVVESARSHGKKTMADMIDVADLRKRALALSAIGVDYICLHTAVDVYTAENSAGCHEEMEEIHQLIGKDKLAVAGGMDPESISRIMPFAPEIIIVGSYITKAADKKAAVRKVREAMLQER